MPRSPPGLDVNAFAQRVSFFFNAHNDFLEEVAKFRAARRLWARLMRERFGATNPRALQLRFHTQTAGSTLTAQQPDNNIVRVALQALAAVLGGTQSLHTNGRDEALALPTEDSARIALRTQQIIAHESGVTNTVDPFAGSYHIEKLTNEIEDGVRELLERIDAIGGTLAAIESGYIQRQIQDSAYKAQLAIDKGDAVVVGVNRYQTDDPDAHRDVLARCRRSKRSSAIACVRCARGATSRAGRPHLPESNTRPRAPITLCPRSSPPSRRTPPSARSPTRCARCSASSKKSHSINAMMADALLSVQNISRPSSTSQASRSSPWTTCRLRFEKGETLGLVGESGSGKSVTAFSIVQLLQAPGRIAAGRVLFQGSDLLSASEQEVRRVRGAGIGLIFQEPMAALNPVMRVGDHIAEALIVHGLAPQARGTHARHRAAAGRPDHRSRQAR